MSNQKDEHRTTACFKRRAAQWNATRSKSRQVQFATSTSAHAAFTEVRGHKHRQSIQATLVKKNTSPLLLRKHIFGQSPAGVRSTRL